MPQKGISGWRMGPTACMAALTDPLYAAGQAICMAASLAYFPQARACVRTELKEKLQEPLTFASIRELPYTFAFMKETLRCNPHPVASCV